MNTFTSDWESLIGGFDCPDWFRDAKFGVWSHWGPQSVPECGDWYARYMYTEGHAMANLHRRRYGHPSVVGYKDICKEWKAERFDAEELVDLYRRNGARYLVGQAAHCDNFDLWNSRHHGWNSVAVGPGRDILGEWCRAARGAGLRFGFSEHLAWAYSWFNVNKGADQAGPYAGVPYDGNDPANQDLYFEPHGDTSASYPLNPSPEFVRHWQARLMDAIDQFDPDLVYTDGGIPFGEVGLELVSHFYNQNMKRRDGGFEAVYTYKDVLGRRPGIQLKNIGEFRPGAGIEDLERGMLGEIMDEPWQTDTSSGPWYYNPSETYKTPEEIVHMLADIVSKNGNLLLNYTQRPDGSLDEETRWIVEQVGAWLAVNGEAIYATRPWRTFGEGETRFEEGEFCETTDEVFTATDFRFTSRGNVVYAICLGRATGEWVIRSLGGEAVTGVSLVGEDSQLDWAVTPEALRIAVPASLGGDLAWSLKVELESSDPASLPG